MFDRENMFSFKQAVTATAVSDDVVYIGKGDAGPGQAVRLEIDSPAVTGGGTVAVAFQHSDLEAGPFTDKATFTIDADALAQGGPVLVATLPTGLKEFLRLNYTVTGTVTGFTPTAGLLYAGQTNTRPQYGK